MTLLKEVSFAMQQNICADNKSGKAGWECGEDWETQGVQALCPVCITLGPGVDALQETYLSTDRLTEAYMVETLGSELLLKSYPQWNEQIAAQGRYRVKRYYFLGSEAKYPIEALPALLESLQVPITCTSAYCMLPKKSVAFYAELAEQVAHETGIQTAQGTEPQDADDQAAGQPAERDEHFCEGICAGCNSTNCPNRMEKRHGNAWETDMTDRPFTYGYQRIFGMR
ncbi:MAG: hypothetical protein IJ794_09030 [Lachnospiraceae bacterium]|nr:hypothetical protein [Lachnospiraceae bacterium]